ncbi:hypothetical protein CRUP_013624 [Coryphaenoides rupestris]|nr:hypothetical protein CRUP_013624 [Coryphaenoides rupestris]
MSALMCGRVLHTVSRCTLPVASSASPRRLHSGSGSGPAAPAGASGGRRLSTQDPDFQLSHIQVNSILQAHEQFDPTADSVLQIHK